MRILVVDDQPNDRALAVYLLRAAGHEVEEAASGSAAMRLIRARPQDGVVSDLMMPGAIDGRQLVGLIRDEDDLIDLRAVAVTCNGTPATSDAAAFDAGFDGYIRKPIDPQTFAETVSGIFAGTA
jgi:two-component system cell cycle response regulator DivK